ncbi:MAG: S-layer homology domain-containing protein [Clostridia bacterium]|nr:S-layer homology domain-containing protein [Clostridia bacterium]
MSFKKIIKGVTTLILTICFTLTLSITCNAEPSAWALSDVNSAIKLGLVPKALQTNYQANISRKDFCSLAVKLFETYEMKDIDTILKENNINDYKNPFLETNLSSDVIACYKLEIVSGDDTNHFRPNDNINRQEAAKILCILSKMFGEGKEKELIDFEDKASIQNWAVPYVDYVVLTGLMNGVKNGTHINFEPRGYYTTQQAIVTIYRLYNNIINYDKELIGNVETFITDKLEGTNGTLKLYNYNFYDDEKEKYNYVDVTISESDYEFKITMTDKQNRKAEINIIGKYNELSLIELDGLEDERELYVKYVDKSQKEYVKILKYQGDHFDNLLTMVNIEYFGNDIKSDGNGKVFGVFHTFDDGSINGYYNLIQGYEIERIIDKNKVGIASVKQDMTGAICIIDGKEKVLSKEDLKTYGLEIGDSVTLKNIYETENMVTIVNKDNKQIKVVVTK